MYDSSLILEQLENVEHNLNDILEWTDRLNAVGDFTGSHTGIILLNAVCMKLIAIGEELKKIDKSDKQLFRAYPEIDWSEAMKMRDMIVHHYSEIDAEIVFDTVKKDVPLLLQTILKIKMNIDKY